MIYALPPMDFLDVARGRKWVECGAGTGLWLRIMTDDGIDIIGYDLYPRGPNVMQGDHRDLAKHGDRALLIVWPPNNNAAQEWADIYPGDTMAICAGVNRIHVPDGWNVAQTWTIKDDGPIRHRGDSMMHLCERIPDWPSDTRQTLQN